MAYSVATHLQAILTYPVVLPLGHAFFASTHFTSLLAPVTTSVYSVHPVDRHMGCLQFCFAKIRVRLSPAQCQTPTNRQHCWSTESSAVTENFSTPDCLPPFCQKLAGLFELE